MKNIIKCCHLTSVHSPFDIRIFHKQSKWLKKAGYDVTIIAPYDGVNIVDGIKIQSVALPKNRFNRMFFTTGKILTLALKEDAQVYHFHDPELMIVGLILKVFGKKVIYDVHEDYELSILTREYLSKPIKFMLSKLVRAFERLFSARFNYIVAATDNIKQKFDNCKSIAIKNYPILLSTLSKSAKNREIGKDFRLIYVGALSPERGIREMMSAVEGMKNVRITLCGNFSPPGFEHEIRAMHEFNKVDYLGFIDPEKVSELMSVADVGMVCLQATPRYVTALPTKLFEYMANGLPVIGSNFPLWKDIIESAECGVCVDPSKPSEIRNAITYLMQHPDKRDEMSKNGVHAVVEKYSWEKESLKLIDIYKKILKGN